MNDDRLRWMTTEEIIDFINQTCSDEVVELSGDTVRIRPLRSLGSHIEARAPRKRQWKYKELE